jgi:hypothetical protein
VYINGSIVKEKSMWKRSSILFMLLISGALVWECKGEPKQGLSQQKGDLQRGELIAQNQKTPAGEAAKDRPEVSGRPKIFFEQTEYDFGNVDQGEKVEHLYLFKNTGDAALLISKVRSS